MEALARGLRPTILWIDDDPLIRACADVLRQHRYRMLFAADGATGLAIASRARLAVIL